MNHAVCWRKKIPGQENSKCGSPEVDTPSEFEEYLGSGVSEKLEDMKPEK